MSKLHERDRQDGFVDLDLHVRGSRGPLGRREAACELASARDGVLPNESTSDTRPTSGWAWTAAYLDSRIPDPVRVAIRLAAGDEAAFAIACRLFIEDAAAGCFEDSVSAARLERAVARSTLDAWARGQGSAEGVGVAYAVVGARVAQVMNITLLGRPT
jgi:hypothetical protein